jgi:hypothetical protein
MIRKEKVIHSSFPIYADRSAILARYATIWTMSLLPSAPPRRTTDPVTSSRPCRSAGWASTVTRHIDTSDQVYFGNDQIGVRFLEEIDFDYLATDATAVLLTAVS